MDSVKALKLIARDKPFAEALASRMQGAKGNQQALIKALDNKKINKEEEQ